MALFLSDKHEADALHSKDSSALVPIGGVTQHDRPMVLAQPPTTDGT